MDQQPTIDFYFDFMSPFCYLAYQTLPDIARRANANLVHHPIDIPGAKVAAGNYGPSNRAVPAKSKALRQDLARWAKILGISLTSPQSYDCRLWNIASLSAADQGKLEAFVRAGYAHIWGTGADPTDVAGLIAVAGACDMDGDALLDFAQSSEGEARFAAECEAAHARGVFGAPIMLVDDQIFWGNDRLPFLVEYLSRA